MRIWGAEATALFDQFYRWREKGANLAYREEHGDSPSDDEYADYDDEAARILLALVPLITGTKEIEDAKR